LQATTPIDNGVDTVENVAEEVVTEELSPL